MSGVGSRLDPDYIARDMTALGGQWDPARGRWVVPRERRAELLSYLQHLGLRVNMRADPPRGPVFTGSGRWR